MASYYFRNTGDANWGTISNWSLSDSSYVAVPALPISTDDVFFTANSGNCVVNITTALCGSFNCTGYGSVTPRTFNMGANRLDIYGNVILSNTMSITSTSLDGLRLYATTCNFTSNGLVIDTNILLVVGRTLNLIGNLSTLKSFTTPGGTINGNDFISVGSGNVFVTNNGGVLQGNSVIRMEGNGGSIGCSSTAISIRIQNPIVINCGAGTISLGLGTASSFRVANGSFTWLSGNISNIDSPSTVFSITVGGTYTLNTNGNNIANLAIAGTQTLINNSPLNITGAIRYLLNSSVNFTGTHSWTANTFDIQTGGAQIHTLKAGLTYTVTSFFKSDIVISGALDILRSDTPGVQAIFTVNPGALQKVAYTNAIDINSNNGQTIYSLRATTLTNATNWSTSVSSESSNNFIFIR